jgi:hypothetical protein
VCPSDICYDLDILYFLVFSSEILQRWEQSFHLGLCCLITVSVTGVSQSRYQSIQTVDPKWGHFHAKTGHQQREYPQH